MRGYLQLSTGEVFEGKWLTETSFSEMSGELVFFTGMTGFQEVLTDPSYKDQIVVFTYPLIGNYGINEQDFESEMPHVAGVVVYEANEDVFHYQAKYTLKQYLQKWNIPLLDQIDTRAVVKKIRDKGSMPAVVSTGRVVETDFILQNNRKVDCVTTKEIKTMGAGEPHIVVVDFGFKHSIVRQLIARNCQVTVVPFNTPLAKILSLKPDGILLSNGPGDPKDLPEVMGNITKLVSGFPTLGICLGHQLTALALGANTKKLAFGHRGANHPVIDLEKNEIFMSSQNHSYVVDEDSLFGTGLTTRFYNLHDHSIEGMIHDSLPLRTVQFHPEANPGPSESEYIFDEFINLVKANIGRVATYA